MLQNLYKRNVLSKRRGSSLPGRRTDGESGIRGRSRTERAAEVRSDGLCPPHSNSVQNADTIVIYAGIRKLKGISLGARYFLGFLTHVLIGSEEHPWLGRERGSRLCPDLPEDRSDINLVGVRGAKPVRTDFGSAPGAGPGADPPFSVSASMGVPWSWFVKNVCFVWFLGIPGIRPFQLPAGPAGRSGVGAGRGGGESGRRAPRQWLQYSKESEKIILRNGNKIILGPRRQKTYILRNGCGRDYFVRGTDTK